VDEAAIYDRLTQIFRDIFDDDTIVLSSRTTAADIPEWDSLNHVNITAASEVAFGVSFSSAELEELRNVGDLVSAIRRKSSL
jgi:acyl carrier protein